MQFHPPLVTELWAGLNGLLALGLAIHVTRTRARLRIGIGDGGNAEMMQAIRLHANNADSTVAMAMEYNKRKECKEEKCLFHKVRLKWSL